ncbi:ABC transporter ATP-binding protein [Desulfoscipio geothermicus]|uniref:Putative ABC transport system ATP-binding protein n=1 Tax=Desulfoscipio geothermicus DSM 3669 TaxID=1121426 RepID=A0A1I6DXF2_9FIRM|nr:ATP-binding cassette domain-containing protein [Desulfoscipio geothermicus]SFR10011.1 putative ABC transport system ATP-binding protein [Desulfoscipio geothermicus DSM 3669]
MINLTGINKYFFVNTPNEIKALDNINLQVNPGDFITIIGSNGAGKSTLLKAVAGVIPVDSGCIEIDGQDVTNLPEHRRAGDIGRIDQDPMASTAAELTIEENLAIACLRGQRRALARAVTRPRLERFRQALRDTGLGLEDRLRVPVGTLSGGQRQALALVMATMTRPRLLLLDEHTAALDPKAASLVMDITERIVNRHQLTTLMITHNMEQALRFGNRLIMMHRGRIILDIGSDEKNRLTVAELIAKFASCSGTVFDNDRALLA